METIWLKHFLGEKHTRFLLFNEASLSACLAVIVSYSHKFS